MLEVRRSLEELAIELACRRMTEDDIKELEEAQEAFRSAIQSADAMTIAETDEHYHDIIYNGTGNNRLVQILNNLREQMYRYRLEYIKDADKRQILVVEHDYILKAIRSRHAAEAKRPSVSTSIIRGLLYQRISKSSSNKKSPLSRTRRGEAYL